MTMAEPGSRLSLRFKLEGTKGDLGRWGHEFLRSLAGEIGQEYSARRMRIVGAGTGAGDGAEEEAGAGGAEAMDDGEVDVSELIELVDDIVPFHLQHNAEAEAVDLLVEVQVRVGVCWCTGLLCVDVVACCVLCAVCHALHYCVLRVGCRCVVWVGGCAWGSFRGVAVCCWGVKGG